MLHEIISMSVIAEENRVEPAQILCINRICALCAAPAGLRFFGCPSRDAVRFPLRDRGAPAHALAGADAFAHARADTLARAGTDTLAHARGL